MVVANYEYSNKPEGFSNSARSKSAYRAAIAWVYGAVDGVPFRNAVKSERAVNNALRAGFQVERA